MIIEEEIIEEDSNLNNVFVIITIIDNIRYLIYIGDKDTDSAIKCAMDKMIEELKIEKGEIKKFKNEFRDDKTIVKKCNTKIDKKGIINFFIKT